MAIKLYVRYEEKLPGYWVLTSSPLSEKESLLNLLFESFNPVHGWIFIDRNNNDTFITQHFLGDNEEDDVILKLSNKNYNHIALQWNKVVEQRSKYLIFSQDNNGWINLELKDKLSQDDFAAIEEDKQIKSKQGNVVKHEN